MPHRIATGATAATAPVAASVAYSGLLFSYIWLALSRGRLIDDPIQSMIQTLPWLSIIQVGYCIVGNHNDGKTMSIKGQKKQKKSDHYQEGFGSLVSVSVSCVLKLCLKKATFSDAGLQLNLVFMRMMRRDRWSLFLLDITTAIDALE
ncbi:hypothetical protein TRICI_001058 [Trichomonascus ciferrii]|uniref:Uncharacterized protein n=1 Tax=Trichomonascus ciferrii TaxID=44093 RepID=A0A642V9E6_9ASCO|nr:hypothetical protein TRICI_001058 [Trichomonascus ciferrii]